jgi:hypothetical protein
MEDYSLMLISGFAALVQCTAESFGGKGATNPIPERTTLNRFPLFGLFAYCAALRMKHPEKTARLLAYSTAVLYAIFKAKEGHGEPCGNLKETI